MTFLGQLLNFAMNVSSNVDANHTVEQMSLLDRMKTPLDVTTNGYIIDNLFNYTTWMVVIFFVLVCIGLFAFSYLYAHKRHPKPLYTHGNQKIHVLVVGAIGVVVFLLIDMKITHDSSESFTKHFATFPDSKKEEIVKIEVMAQQWMWNVRYAGKDEVFNTEDDVVTNNDLRVPVGKKVVVQVTAKDVLHSFWLPNAKRKVDAMPGRVSRIWYEFDKIGNFEIACAQMCGTNHYRMRGWFKVLSQEDYKTWMENAQEIAKAENDPEETNRFWGWKWED